MSSYTITIAPDDQTRATTTLRVEVTDNATRITELLVRAGEGDGLTPGQLPAVDLDQLLRAVMPGSTTLAVAASPPASASSGAHATDPAVDTPRADVPPAPSAEVPEVTPQPSTTPVEIAATTVDAGVATGPVVPQPRATTEVAPDAVRQVTGEAPGAAGSTEVSTPDEQPTPRAVRKSAARKPAGRKGDAAVASRRSPATKSTVKKATPSRSTAKRGGTAPATTTRSRAGKAAAEQTATGTGQSRPAGPTEKRAPARKGAAKQSATAGETVGTVAGTAPKKSVSSGSRASTTRKSAPARKSATANKTATKTASASKTATARKSPTASKTATATASKNTAGRSSAATARSNAPAPAAGRSYRRAPEDLAAVFGQAGTATAVADHYGVPRHTAQSWIRTLRRNQDPATN